MTDNHDRFHDGPREFSDETIRRFLLGVLRASEQPSFEQCLITDDGLDARVRLVEFDLADDYAFGRLSAADQRRFEEGFLLTSNRQQKLEVSRALRDRFSSTPATAIAALPEKNSVAGRLVHLFGLDQSAWRIAFGVLTLFILLGTVWLVVKEPRLTEQIANKIIPKRSSPRSAPREVNHPTNTSSPEHHTTPSPMPLHDQTAATRVSVSIALRSGLSPQRGEMPSLSLPKGDQDVVRLQLALKPDQTGSYQAELLTIEGSSVFRAESLTPNDSRAEINFDVPARLLLKTGDYQVKLSRVDGGSQGSVAIYYFRVQ